jgi:peptidoglycan/LPS O-acetylase OafA/YrhL
VAEAARGGMRIPKYIPQFDGLRGIAILVVLLAHLTYLDGIRFARVFEYGRTGVDLFFVLSGFLITGILLDTKELPGYFKNFYARRALRIWPPYYAVFLIFFVLSPLFSHGGSFLTDVKTWPYYATYTQNLFFNFPKSVPLGPTWSLAVEEQYYFFWAPVVFFCGRKSLRNILLGMIVFSLCFRAASFFRGASLDFVHDFTLCRLEPLAAGGLAALWLRSDKCNLRKWNGWATIALMVGVSGVRLALIDWGFETRIYSYPFLAAAFAGMLALSLTANQATTFLGRALTQRWLVYTGRISYGVYLIHVPIFICMSLAGRRLWGTSQYSAVKQALMVCMAFAAVYAVASISWFCFERPILRLKERFRSAKTAVEGAPAR